MHGYCRRRGERGSERKRRGEKGVSESREREGRELRHPPLNSFWILWGEEERGRKREKKECEREREVKRRKGTEASSLKLVLEVAS